MKICCSVIVCAIAMASAARGATEIGSRVEMLVDEYLVDQKQSVELRLNPPVKREIVLTMDQPWEGPVSAYYSVFRDGEKIRLYYRGSDDDKITCYAESTDGIHYTRPNLGLIEFKGSKENNIIWQGDESASFAPFRDENPDCKPDERYKAICYTVMKRKGGMRALASPDGIHWKRMQDDSILPFGSYDSLNCVSWDKSEKQYRMFDRYWNAGAFKGVRAVETRTSADFLNWSKPTPFVYTSGVPLEHFYTSATTRCPGAEHFWLAFPMRLMPERKKVAEHKEPAVSDAVFMSSRDGVHWDRPFLEAWVRPGTDERNWTDRCNMPAWGIVATAAEPDVFNMYISEHYRWPDNRLRRLTIPRHRFASMHAGAKSGEFTTQPMTFDGSNLILNYATGAAGSVKVELQNELGKPIAGFAEADMQPLYGDEFDAFVLWKGGNLDAWRGKSMRLRFIMADADIYAFRFGESPIR